MDQVNYLYNVLSIVVSLVCFMDYSKTLLNEDTVYTELSIKGIKCYNMSTHKLAINITIDSYKNNQISK